MNHKNAYKSTRRAEYVVQTSFGGEPGRFAPQPLQIATSTGSIIGEPHRVEVEWRLHGAVPCRTTNPGGSEQCPGARSRSHHASTQTVYQAEGIMHSFCSRRRGGCHNGLRSPGLKQPCARPLPALGTGTREAAEKQTRTWVASQKFPQLSHNVYTFIVFTVVQVSDIVPGHQIGEQNNKQSATIQGLPEQLRGGGGSQQG